MGHPRLRHAPRPRRETINPEPSRLTEKSLKFSSPACPGIDNPWLVVQVKIADIPFGSAAINSALSSPSFRTRLPAGCSKALDKRDSRIRRELMRRLNRIFKKNPHVDHAGAPCRLQPTRQLGIYFLGSTPPMMSIVKIKYFRVHFAPFGFH